MEDNSGSNGGDQGKCISIVSGFIEHLADIVVEDIESGKATLTVERVLSIAEQYVRRHGSCAVSVSLVEVYQQAAKLALDKVMEALSRHMESIDENTYAILSASLTRYAAHVARLVYSILEASRALLGLLVDAVEPIVFASLARLLAVARAVQRMPSNRVVELAPRIQRVVEAYMTEDNDVLARLFSVIA